MDSPDLRMPMDKKRNTLSLSDLRNRTPIVDNIISMLPTGHDKALKYAFYNVLALIFAGVSLIALWAVYCILEPFIKSLMWALLCGSVLYPFKRKLVTAAQTWLENVKKSPVPFSVHILSSPIVIADSVSDKIGDYVFEYWKSIGAGLLSFFGAYVVYYNPPVTLGLILKWFLTTSFSVTFTMLSWVRGDVLIALHAVYGGVILRTLMSRRNSTQQNNDPTEQIPSTSSDTRDNTPLLLPVTPANEYEGTLLRTLSIITWGLSLVYLCRKMPYTLLIPFDICMVAGAVAYFRGRSRQTNFTIPHISMLAAKLVMNIGSGSREIRPPIRSKSSGDLGYRMRTLSSPVVTTNYEDLKKSFAEQANKHQTHMESDHTETDEHKDWKRCSSPSLFSEDEVDGAFIDSNMFLYGVFLACVVVQVWNHLWLLTHLLPIPVLYYGLKKLCFKFGIAEFLKKSISEPITEFYSEEQGLSSDLFPMPVRVLFKVMSIADTKLCEFCEAYLDPVASSIILVVVVLLSILVLIFAATQVYFEGDHLVRVSIDLVNSTVSQHPEINKLLPEGWESMMSSMVENAYVHGREYITNTIRDSVEEKDPERARELEKQVIELWDKVYLSWNKTWDGNTFKDPSKDASDGEEGSGIEWNELLETGKNVPQLLEFSILANYVKANLGTLMSLLESLWNIVIGNVSVAFSAVTAVLSVLFGGGSAIVNLMINFVVFFTALFYLLSSSTSVYKPVEMFSTSIPGNGKHSGMFLCAVEEAINGVFTASFKMGAFYGLWTYFIHSIFQINIVFVPSFLAAMFGAIPLLAPYWAALPAVLELSLIQGEWTLAVLILIAQMAPMSMVDTQIYSEIKGGGHPYLTGLAVAGGIFYFGIQGGIVGPVILCCVFVAVKMGSSYLRDEADGPVEMLPQNPRVHLSSESRECHNPDATTA